jgi:plastocyanin
MMKLRTFLCAGSCALAVAILSSCAADPDTSMTTAATMTGSVSIAKDAAVGHFTPDDVEVSVGGSVVWVNNSGVVHNVIFDDTKVASSKLFYDGEKFQTEFSTAGVFSYHCSVHPTMKGTVSVQ